MCRWLFVSSLLFAALPAQVGPSLLAPHAPSAWLDFTLPPLNALPTGPAGMVSLSAAKLNLPPGVWTLCLSMMNCPGCAGVGDILIATVDLNTTPPTLTPTNEAALINTASHEEMFKIEPGQGLLGVYEIFQRVNGSLVFDGTYLTDRPIVGAQFGNPRRILNVNGIFRGFSDPAIGFVNDSTGRKLKLFWVGVNYIPNTFTLVRGVWMQDLDITSAPATPFVRGPLKLVAVESRPGWAINSPAPIAGPDGDVEGMLVWERDWQSLLGNTRDNDAFFADDFDPNTPNVVAMDTAGTWSNNGTMLGNLVLAAEDFPTFPAPSPAPPIYAAAHEGTSVWLLGDFEPIGSSNPNPVDIRIGAPSGSVAFVFLSSALLPVPAPCPTACIGQIGIGPNIGLLGTVSVGVDAIGDFSFPTPANPSLAGVWHIQGAVLGSATQPLALTNTAKIQL